MNRQIVISLIALLAMLLGSLSCMAQVSYNMQNDDTLNIIVTDSMVIYDDGGPNGNYTNNFNGYVRLLSTEPITISGTVNTESCCDYLKVYDGYYLDDSLLVSTSKGTAAIPNFTSTEGCLLLYFHSDVSVAYSGFTLMVTPQANATPVMVRSIAVDSITENSAEVTWECVDTNSRFMVAINGGGTSDTFWVDTNYMVISGLQSGTRYMVYVVDTANIDKPHVYMRAGFRTLCSAADMIWDDFTDLYACSVTCTYGSYDDPYANEGVVDYGYLDKFSRHTVVTNVNAMDSCTNYMLPMVPPGERASVRLGNWNNGGQAESISYLLRVDTTKSDMLILRYSAVLEDPSHEAAAQPKFTFKIADSTGASLSSCYEAEFIASQILGWNQVDVYGYQILYKDWTTVGANLTPLHGQLITITLTTYDCSYSAHYGYAYFTLGLGQKRIYSDQCGDATEYVFHVPEGFTYRWYREDNPSVTVGDSSTVTLTQSGTYNCEVGFVGNPNCSFTLQALAGPRYPVSQFTSTIDTTGCQYRVNFHNASVIATDSLHTQLTTMPCEDYLWIFDDTITSTKTNASQVFNPGHHTAKLLAYLGNFGCADTSTWEFDVEIAYSADYYDTVCENRSLTFRGEEYDFPGDYTIVPNPTEYCDTIHYLHLATWPTFDTDEFDTICYGDNNFRWHDGNYYNEVTTEPQVTFSSVKGCDSVVHLNLHIDTSVVAQIGSFSLFGPIVAEEGDKVILQDVSINGADRIWQIGGYTFSEPRVAVDYFFYTDEDSLEVTMIAIGPQPRKCLDTTTSVIRSVKAEIWAPNVFTPRRSDNNRWYLVGRNINTVGVHIYDRDGMEVCHLTRMEQSWDGTNKHGRRCVQGSYTYRVFYTTIGAPSTTKSFVGSILLLE